MSILKPKYPKILRDRDNYRKWYLDEETIVTLHNGDKLTIPKGYRFDGHSVPFGFRWIFPKNKGKDIYCAMIHDFLIDIEMFLRYNRDFQDKVYKVMMSDKDYMTNKWRSYFMPKSVRFFGFLRYTLWGDYRGESKKFTSIKIEIKRKEYEHKKKTTGRADRDSGVVGRSGKNKTKKEKIY